jgi:hypothetical protein
MSEQPTALRLADALTNRHGIESFEGDAANELRRLHEENKEMLVALKSIMDTVESYARGQLTPAANSPVAKARAAIAKAEGTE